MYCNMYFGHVVLVHLTDRVLSFEMSELFSYYIFVVQEISIVILIYSRIIMYVQYCILDIRYGML
jgi:hypothetical protein